MNNKKQKLDIDRAYKENVVTTFGLGIALLFSIIVFGKRGADYVVKDKLDNRLILNLCGNETSIRIMNFTEAANGMEYFKNINVGDTLRLIYYNADNMVFSNFYHSKLHGKDESSIMYINGKTLQEVMQNSYCGGVNDKVIQSKQKVR